MLVAYISGFLGGIIIGMFLMAIIQLIKGNKKDKILQLMAKQLEKEIMFDESIDDMIMFKDTDDVIKYFEMRV